MPNIKRNFTGGKMNKDVDERLVPKGEYRHAMNVQVSTSEGSDSESGSNIGTVTNILGNIVANDTGTPSHYGVGLRSGMKCVGVVADEKNDAFYWFVSGEQVGIDYNSFTSASPQGLSGLKKDMIMQYKNGVLTPVFVATGTLAYTAYVIGGPTKFDHTTGVITFPSQYSVGDFNIGMTMQASGPNAFNLAESHISTISGINTANNTITISGDYDWWQYITVGFWSSNSKFFFYNDTTNSFGTILNFNPDKFVTGINIIDDMLFWTDGYHDEDNNLQGSEPKKINISRSIAGTAGNGLSPTNFINTERSISTPAREEHITVIKKSPTSAPVLELISTRKAGDIQDKTGLTKTSFEDIVNNPGELLNPGDVGTMSFNSSSNAINTTCAVGDFLILEKFAVGVGAYQSFPLRDPIVELEITSITPAVGTAPIATNGLGGFQITISYKINYIDPSTPLANVKFAVDIKTVGQSIFKFKYPKFATRYKYIDNEYSAFSPFTQPAFIPESWDYQTKKGQNLGMQNMLKTVNLNNIIPTDIPDGVVQVDVLYKESGSTNIYLVDKVKINDGSSNWVNNQYSIDSELIYSVVADNQILRPYDNVPRKALAQEVTGNRLVYGNYVQNYNSLIEENPIFDISLAAHTATQTGDKLFDSTVPFLYENTKTHPLRSIKSLREYQIGVVFEDKYGRQSPVMTSSSASINVPKTESATANLFDLKIDNTVPSWAESFRFFIKETSNEYYNLAMDRWFEAEDGNLWLSFPSSDRNKLTEESIIVLKKVPEVNLAVFDETEYKVLAISNEVPPFVKSAKITYGLATEASGALGATVPVESGNFFSLSPFALQTTISDAALDQAMQHFNEERTMASKRLFVRFHKQTTPKAVTDYYEISSMTFFDFNTTAITTDPDIQLKISGSFGKDILGVVNPSGGWLSNINVELARETDVDRSIYDGRFFAKIHKDASISAAVLAYNFAGGSKTTMVINPKFLHYQGNKQMFNGQLGFGVMHYNNFHQATPSTVTPQAPSQPTQSYGTSAIDGNNKFANDPDWSVLNQLHGGTGKGRLSYTWISSGHKNCSGSAGVQGVTSGATLGDGSPGSTGSVGEDINTLGTKPGEAGFGRFPRPYPYMVDGTSDSYCIPYLTGMVHASNLDRGGSFWHNDWYSPVKNQGWFIDMEPTWHYGADLPPNYYPSFENPVPTRGVRNTPGRGARIGSKSMDISYTGSDYGSSSANLNQNGKGAADLLSNKPVFNFTDPDNIAYDAFLMTPGSQFQFNGDPGRINYTILSCRRVTKIINTHYDQYCDGTGSTSNTFIGKQPWNWLSGWGVQGLFRVRYELELDQPIGTTVQDQGIITPVAYVAAGGTPDEANAPSNATGQGSQGCNSAPVYAPSWDPSNETGGMTFDGGLTWTACSGQAGAYYDRSKPGFTYHNNQYINSSLWQNKDGSVNLGFVPTQSNTHSKEIAYGNVNTVGPPSHVAPLAPVMAAWEPGQYDSPNITNLLGNSLLNYPGGTSQPATYWDHVSSWPNELYVTEPWQLTTFGQGESNSSANPAIWETLPKETIDLELYYESSQSYPVKLSSHIGSNAVFIPIGSVLSNYTGIGQFASNTTVITWFGKKPKVFISALPTTDPVAGDIIKFAKPDGSYTTGVVDSYATGTFEINLVDSVANNRIGLAYYNCFAFGNGIESNRISDTFNSDFIDKGVKASTVLESDYKVEHRKNGLIYSGIYNSTSGVNNLNQFIAAEKITKDLNHTYGSIQKLHSRSTADGDLIALCEDRVLKILANKDAVFNADGNPQLIANNNVLGQAIPFSGQYGISKNPESFASESYRVYFTDKVRGAVLRLSKDGLTPISDYGMKNWFKDNFPGNNGNIIGSHDDKKNEYNVTFLNYNYTNTYIAGNLGITVSFKEDVRGWVSFKSFAPEAGISCANEYYTFSMAKAFRHHDTSVQRNHFYGLSGVASSLQVIFNDSPGTVKSFNTINYEGSQSKVNQFLTDPGTGLSDGEYYNLHDKEGWYVDGFTTLPAIYTDLETGSIPEFIEKEGKWFNYIKGTNVAFSNLTGQIVMNADGSSTFDQASFSIQGLGKLNTPAVTVSNGGCTDSTALNYNASAFFDDGSCTYPILGCFEPTANNFDCAAGNTTYPCSDSVTVDNGSCRWFGCTDATASNYTTFPPQVNQYQATWSLANATIDDGSCIPFIYGCTDLSAVNYDLNANSLCDGGVVGCDNAGNGICTGPGNNECCVATHNGCMEANADNFDAAANNDNGTCQWNGCNSTLATNYGWNGWANSGWPSNALAYIPVNNTGFYGIIDNGSCLGGGCLDDGVNFFTDASGSNQAPQYQGFVDIYGNTLGPWPATNYDATATYDDGSCTWNYGCSTPYADNYDATVPPFFPYSVVPTSCNVSGCLTSTAVNFGCATNMPDGTFGINSPSSCFMSPPVNLQQSPTICNIVTIGCNEPNACNFDPNTTLPDNSTCDYIECAGCMDAAAVNHGIKTTTNPPNSTNFAFHCNSPTNLFLPCSISCGDGTDATSQGLSCCNYTVPGCPNASFCNYTPPPTTGGWDGLGGNVTVVDDGSCSNVLCAGCNNPAGANYGTNVLIPLSYNYQGVQSFDHYDSDGYAEGTTCTTTDPSTPGLGCLLACSVNANNPSWSGFPGNDDCCEFIYGCMDDTILIPGSPDVNGNGSYAATNYNPNATVNAVNATVPASVIDPCHYPVYGCTDNGNNINGAGVVNDANGDSLPAFNYYHQATVNQVSALDTSDPCVAAIYGCMDGAAVNFNSAANSQPSPSGCDYLGCTDATATNYDPAATIDDGSCAGACVWGCLDVLAINHNCAPGNNPVGGFPCTDSITCDDGSCYYPFAQFYECDNSGACIPSLPWSTPNIQYNNSTCNGACGSNNNNNAS